MQVKTTTKYLYTSPECLDKNVTCPRVSGEVIQLDN